MTSRIVTVGLVCASLYAAALGAGAVAQDEQSTPVPTAAAEALLEEIEEVTRPHEQEWLMRFDERIHRFTWEAAGNPYLLETLERYFTHSLRIWYLVLDRLPGLGHAVHDQAHLLEALLAEDGPRARAIMRKHVLDFQREILAAFSRST